MPLGVLVWRSRLQLSFLGAWLLANGAAYVVPGLAGILWLATHEPLFEVAPPPLFGESAQRTHRNAMRLIIKT